MKAVSALVTLLVAVGSAVAQQFTINTPTGVTSCQPTRFTWVGGSGPFILQLTEGTTTGGALLKEFDNLTGDGFTWNVDVPGGTNFICNLKGVDGVIAQSAAVTVGNGSNSCVNSTVTESPSGQTSIPVSTGAPSASAPGGSPSNTAPSGSPTTSAPAGSTTGASQSSKPSQSSTGGSASQTTGASQQLTAGTVGFAGLMGMIGAMLF